MTMGTNIFEIAEKIFLDSPKPKQSIQLELDNSDNNTVFELLVLFIMEGITVKYDNEDFDKLNNLDDNELYDKIYFKFREYLQSIGFNIVLKINPFENLHFSNTPSFYPSKKYDINFCTFIVKKHENNHIFLEYNEVLKSIDLKDYILIIPLNKYLLQISFDFC